MANTDYRSEQLVASIRLMIGRRVAGLAAIVSEMEPALIEELTESSIPVVFYDVGAPRPNITNIRVNYRRGIDKVIDYLYSLGHRKLGFVGHHAMLGPHQRAHESGAGRRGALFRPRSAHRRRRRYPRRRPPGRPRAAVHPARSLTAIVCVNDVMAVGALRELRERGIRVPQDVSVTGFDNVKLSEFCYPALTTVHIPRDTIGHHHLRIVCFPNPTRPR